MKTPLTLVHLVSGQTLQNLLPIMAFRPDRIVQVRSADSRFKRTAKALREAVRCAGIETKVEDKVIPHRSPDIEQTATWFAEHFSASEGGQVIVNITGGTKLMSIGAARAAGDRHTCLYCDTEGRGEFLRVGGPELPEHRSFAEVVAQLEVRTVMVAHGIDPRQLRTEIPDERQLAFARAVADLRADRAGNEAVSKYLAKVRKRFHEGFRFHSGNRLFAALRQPLPPVTGDAEHAFLAAACEARHVRPAGPGSFCLEPNPDRSDAKRMSRLARKHFKALEGGWWELEVYRRALASEAFIDLRAEVQSSAVSSIGETDLVGISRRQRALTFISCKVSDQFVKPLEHAFEFSSRARQFGGTAARAVFVFHHVNPKSQHKRDQLHEACQTLRSTLLVGASEVEAWLAEQA